MCTEDSNDRNDCSGYIDYDAMVRIGRRQCSLFVHQCMLSCVCLSCTIHGCMSLRSCVYVLQSVSVSMCVCVSCSMLVCLSLSICVCVCCHIVAMTSVELQPTVIPHTTLHATVPIGQIVMLGHSVGNSGLTVHHLVLPQIGVCHWSVLIVDSDQPNSRFQGCDVFVKLGIFCENQL